MCIIFIWQKEDVGETKLASRYKFILAANRDEFFSRPASPAQFWKEHPHILSGRDLTAGVVGGTWIGITKSGKISCLTNIRCSPSDMSTDQKKRGRGSLVSNFLKDNVNTLEYFDGLQKTKSVYRPFNFIAGNVMEDLFYINSVDENHYQQLQKGCTCISNGVLTCEWLKIMNSRKKFLNVLTNCSNDDNDDVIQKLLKLLEDKDRNYPDENIKIDSPLVNEWCSSIFVPLSYNQYGTRTNTVITVDNSNHVTFVERTKENLNDPPSEWRIRKYEFDVML